MTLEIGSQKRHASGAFTLIEILLVIGLIALASGLVMFNFTAIADRGEETDPVEILHAAVRSARFQAAANREITRLAYDEESGALQIKPGGEKFRINADFGPNGRGSIKFYLGQPGRGLGDVPDPADSRVEVAEVAFAPDRSSSPFSVEIDSGSGSPLRLVYDPFSSIIVEQE